MHEKNPVCKSIRRLAIGAVGPSRDPAAVKRNDVQELAVEIPVCQERKSSLGSSGGRKKPKKGKKTKKQAPHDVVPVLAIKCLVHFCVNLIRGTGLLLWK